jgi:hypothetical protein
MVGAVRHFCHHKAHIGDATWRPIVFRQVVSRSVKRFKYPQIVVFEIFKGGMIDNNKNREKHHRHQKHGDGDEFYF